MSGVYWVLVVLLVGFGVAGIFSIGAPFLLIGVTLALLAPFRSRRTVFWPVLVGVVAFIVGFLLVTPLGCTTTTAPVGTAGSTECANLVGIDYSGSGTYNPSLLPALLTGLAMGAFTTLALRLFATRSIFSSHRGQAEPS